MTLPRLFDSNFKDSNQHPGFLKSHQRTMKNFMLLWIAGAGVALGQERAVFTESARFERLSHFKAGLS